MISELLFMTPLLTTCFLRLRIYCCHSLDLTVLKTDSFRNNICINIRDANHTDIFSLPQQPVSPNVDFFNISYWLSKYLVYFLELDGHLNATKFLLSSIHDPYDGHHPLSCCDSVYTPSGRLSDGIQFHTLRKNNAE
jgi:hypothetical protein